MLRSRASRFLVVAVALCAAAVVVLLSRGGEQRVAAGGGAGLSAGGRDAARARPERARPERARPERARPERPRRRLTDAQAIERVRRVTPWVSRGQTRKKLIALTFDDGPGPMTPALQAELQRLRVPATFFQVARLVDSRRDAARRAHRWPFATGSHTVSHARLTRLSPGSQRSEIAGGADAIKRNSGAYPRLFRPPYGAWNDATVATLKRRRALMVFWSISSRDWRLPNDHAIARRVIRQAHPGAIVLMHDFGGLTREPTLRAVPRIVRALRRKGYRFVTVPEMLRQAPPRRRLPRPPSPYPL